MDAMARYEVTVNRRGDLPQVHRFSARDVPAAVSTARSRELVCGRDPDDAVLVVTSRRPRRRRTVVVAGARFGEGDQGGTAGVREPRRPSPAPPHDHVAREPD
jgi:hypothetical protein